MADAYLVIEEKKDDQLTRRLSHLTLHLVLECKQIQEAQRELSKLEEKPLFKIGLHFKKLQIVRSQIVMKRIYEEMGKLGIERAKGSNS